MWIASQISATVGTAFFQRLITFNLMKEGIPDYRRILVTHDTSPSVVFRYHPLGLSQSFTDQSMASGFPLVVITNPKHAQYLTPTKEPIKSIFYSTHVRILAFSDVPIALVTVYVDDGKKCVYIITY